MSIIRLKDVVTLCQVELVDGWMDGWRSLLRRCFVEIQEQPDRRYRLNRLVYLYFM